MRKLEILLGQTDDRNPLVTVGNFPGMDAEMTPMELRSLATALNAAADECESRPMDKRRYMPAVRVYEYGA